MTVSGRWKLLRLREAPKALQMLRHDLGSAHDPELRFEARNHQVRLIGIGSNDRLPSFDYFAR